MNNTRRVVVTGVGLLTPLACGVNETWNLLLEGKSGINKIEGMVTDDLSSKVAGQIPISGDHSFDVNKYISEKELKKMDKFISYAIATAQDALVDSDILNYSKLNRERVGVIIGSGIGGLPLIEKTAKILHEKGARRVSPFFIPASLVNLAPGHVSISHGFKGPNESIVTACSTGAHAIAQGARLIKTQEADVMVVGGAESAICRLGIAGFASMRALSTHFNEEPEKSSRPWDKDRDGFVMAEGSGILILEEYEHAKKRGAKIYAEVAGYGESSDAYHIASPDSEGKGAFKAMSIAMKNAHISTDDVDYINAHSTSTPAGDIVEISALRRLFNHHIGNIPISSTKSSLGHLLGAAGSVEAILSILAMRDSIMPPTLNLDNPDEACDGLNLIPHNAQEKKLKTVLSNSFGFGGTNISLIFSKLN